MPANRIRRWLPPMRQRKLRRSHDPDPYGPAAGAETVSLLFAALLLLLAILAISYLWH